MRYIGIYSPSRPEAILRFLDFTAHPDSTTRPPATILSFPPERPIVALAFDKRDTKLAAARLADGTFAVMDGEVYNFAGHEMQRNSPGSPAEVAGALLGQYRAEGISAYGRINGYSSTAVWDSQTDQLLLFRARCGIPPLYYTQRDDVVFWAPDLKTLLSFGAPRDIDYEALDLFLSASYVPAPWTMFRQVRKVPSGRVVRITGGTLSTLPYYQLAWKPKHSLSQRDTVSRFRTLFEQALERRIDPQRRYAVLLSGGVDSALLVAGLSHLIGSDSVEAFTFDYPRYEGIYNESPQARRTAAHFRVRHHMITFGPPEVERSLDQFLWQYEEPFAYGLHTAWLGDVAANGFKVVFTGTGPVSTGLLPTQHWAAEFAQIRSPSVLGLSAKTLQRGESLFPRVRGLRRVLELAATPLPVAYTQPRMSMDVNRRLLLADSDSAHRGSKKAATLFAQWLYHMQRESYRDQLLYLRMASDLPENVGRWSHQWSSAHDLTIRDPFWDDDLIAFHIRLARRYAGKDDLRQLALSFMPPEMAFAPKIKQSVPIGHWLRGPLREWLLSHLSPDQIRHDGIFRPDTVSWLIDEHVKGGTDHGWTLWALLAVSVWLDVAVRERTGPPQRVPVL